MKKNITILGVPLFFILPWLSYLIALTNMRSRASALIYILFAAFFGYSISFLDTSSDSYRYAEAFASFVKQNNNLNIIEMYLSGELRDVYRITLFYITSLISQSAHIVFAFAGFIYGIISYLNLRIFFIEQRDHSNIYTLILALLIITFCSVSSVNGFRFNTAAMLAFYSTYKLIMENKKLWIFGLSITPLLHYSFFIFVPVILVLKLILPLIYKKDSIKPIALYSFITTFFLSFFLDTNLIDISFITNNNILPSEASRRLYYINSSDVTNIIESRANNSLFLTVNNIFNNIISFYLLIVVLYIWMFIKRHHTYSKQLNLLFAFLLVYFSFAFLALSFPSGGRFLSIAYIFLVLLLLKFYNTYKTSKIKKLIVLSLIPFMFQIVWFNIGIPFLILSKTFWYGGFLGVILEHSNLI